MSIAKFASLSVLLVLAALPAAVYADDYQITIKGPLPDNTINIAIAFTGMPVPKGGTMITKLAGVKGMPDGQDFTGSNGNIVKDAFANLNASKGQVVFTCTANTDNLMVKVQGSKDNPFGGKYETLTGVKDTFPATDVIIVNLTKQKK